MEKYLVKKVINKKEINACVPGSKSITNRALLLAALSDGECKLESVLFSDDSRHFMQALKDLGFSLSINEAKAEVIVRGEGGNIPKKEAEVYVGSAGTAARFLTAFLGLSKGRYHMKASEQMTKRPMKELLLALEEIGSIITYEGEPYHFPFTIGLGESVSTSTTINIDKSSQFLSALLISSVLLPDGFTVNIDGSHGMKYVEMTLKMMEQFAGKQYTIENGAVITTNSFKYHCDYYVIEPDMSAAAYFYGIGALLGVKTTVKNVHFDSLQGDIAFLHVLESMGCSVKDASNGVFLLRKLDSLKGGSFDLSAFSDQALTLAVLAAFADGNTVIEHVDHIRYQECDRINAIVSNLNAMGIESKEADGTITIIPGKPHGATIHTFEDHRVAMSFAMAGTMIDGIEILDPMCCKKTFETYFDCLEEYVY